MKLALAALVLLSACSKKAAPPPPAPAAAATPAPSASTPPAPKPLRKLAPESVSASSEYDKPGEKHLAEHAFDGDTSTAWGESVKGIGKGEWLEAKFRVPQRLRRLRIIPGYEGTSPTHGDLFVANAHIKTLRLRFDDDPTKELVRAIDDTERFVVVNLNIAASRVRIIADDVYPGTKWEDLSVAEVELWGDESTEPSGAYVASIPDLDAQLNKLDDSGWKASTPEPVKLLASLGFPAAQLKPFAYARVDTARRFARKLDADEGDELIVEVVLFNQGDSEGKTFYQYFWTFLDDAAHGYGILGRRAQMTVGCQRDEGDSDDSKPGRPRRGQLAELETKKIHDTVFDDVLVRWTSTSDCTKGTRGAFVVSAARGAIDVLANWSAPFESEDKPLALEIFGEPPARLEVTEDGATKSKLTFDTASFRYR